MPPAVHLIADIVERADIHVAPSIERHQHQRIRGARVHQCKGGRHAHRAVVQLIFRTVDAVTVQKAERNSKDVRRLVSSSHKRILEAVERVADLFYVNGLAEVVIHGVFTRAAVAGARSGVGRLQRVLPICLQARAAHPASLLDVWARD